MYYGLVPNTTDIIRSSMNEWIELLTALSDSDFDETSRYAENLVKAFLADILPNYPVAERYGGISLWFARSLSAQLATLMAAAFPNLNVAKIIPAILPDCHNFVTDNTKLISYSLLYTEQRILPHPDLCLLPTLTEIKTATPNVTPSFPMTSMEMKPQILYYRKVVSDDEVEFAFKLHVPPLFVSLMSDFSAMIPTPFGPRFYSSPELCRGVSYRTKLDPRSLARNFDFAMHSYISLDQYITNTPDYLRPLFLCSFPHNYWNISYVLTQTESTDKTDKYTYNVKIRLTTQTEVGIVYIESCMIRSSYLISSGNTYDTKLVYKPNLIHRNPLAVSVIHLSFSSSYKLTTEMLQLKVNGWCLFETVDLYL